MSKSNSCENSLLLLIFNNTAFADIGDASGLQPSAVAGSLYIALHTADPGEAGDATTSETAYTGYARQAVARTSGGFTVTGNSVAPTANVEFPECTASPGAAITHFSITTAVSGATVILYSGTATPNVAVAVGVIPRVKTSSAITED